MLPDLVSNPGPLTYESGALPTALCGPAVQEAVDLFKTGHLVNLGDMVHIVIFHCLWFKRILFQKLKHS